MGMNKEKVYRKEGKPEKNGVAAAGEWEDEGREGTWRYEEG